MSHIEKLRSLLWLAVIFKRRSEQKLLQWLIRSGLQKELRESALPKK